MSSAASFTQVLLGNLAQAIPFGLISYVTDTIVMPMASRFGTIGVYAAQGVNTVATLAAHDTKLMSGGLGGIFSMFSAHTSVNTAGSAGN